MYEHGRTDQFTHTNEVNAMVERVDYSSDDEYEQAQGAELWHYEQWQIHEDAKRQASLCPNCASCIDVEMEGSASFCPRSGMTDDIRQVASCTQCRWKHDPLRGAPLDATLVDSPCPECEGAVLEWVTTAEYDRHFGVQPQNACQCQDCNWGA